jgi:hypothetical protein
MNLPFVLDVAIGLMFIFLILSLLASELQELLTTILQWRAKHLKDSIEIFLAGGSGTREEEQVKDLVSRLYDDPLIKNINQEAKGLISGSVRQLTRMFPGNRKGAFGTNQTTGPSYIAPDTFATSLLERLGLSTLAQKLVEVRLDKFSEGIENRIKSIAEKANVNLNQLEHSDNFGILQDDFNDILNDFKSGNASLETCLVRMGENFNSYVTIYSESPPSNSEPVDQLGNLDFPLIVEQLEPTQFTQVETNPVEVTLVENRSYFARRLKDYKLSLFGEKNDRAIQSGGLHPSLSELADLATETSQTYREVQQSYEQIVTEGKRIDDLLNPEVEKLLLEEQIEVLEKQLVDTHADVLEAQLHQSNQTEILESDAKILNTFEKQIVSINRQIQKLTKSVQRCHLSHQRRDAVYSSSLGVKQEQTKQLHRLNQKHRQLTFATLNRLSLLQRQKVVHSTLDRISLSNQELRHDVVNAALMKLSNDQRYLITDSAFQVLIQNHGFQVSDRAIYDDYQTYRSIQQVLAKLPNSVKESLGILARRAQTEIQTTRSDIHQFQTEVATWFDRSMSRASGVYKRNAKGIALAIGFLLATLTNSDAFYIADRLSNDENLRNVITQQASKLEPGRTSLSNADEIKQIKDKTDLLLREIALPMGWNPINLSQQLGCQKTPPLETEIFGLTRLVNACLSNQQSAGNLVQDVVAIVTQYPIGLLRMIMGWIISGIAISMGAPFWFDLLGKIVNVRNSGSKPPSESSRAMRENNPK